MSEWRPIETAPGDNYTIVWLWYPDVIRGTEGFTYRYDDGEIGASSGFKGMKPSHWMPLPEGPRE